MVVQALTKEAFREWLETDLNELTDAAATLGSQAALRRYLLAVLTELRREFARRLKIQRQELPNHSLPCATCAFRTGTDHWDGMDNTVVRFIAALESDQIFYCHHGMKLRNGEYVPPKKHVKGKVVVDTSRMVPCGAWVSLAQNPPLRIADYVSRPMRLACVEMTRLAGRS